MKPLGIHHVHHMNHILIVSGAFLMISPFLGGSPWPCSLPRGAVDLSGQHVPCYWTTLQRWICCISNVSRTGLEETITRAEQDVIDLGCPNNLWNCSRYMVRPAHRWFSLQTYVLRILAQAQPKPRHLKPRTQFGLLRWIARTK